MDYFLPFGKEILNIPCHNSNLSIERQKGFSGPTQSLRSNEIKILCLQEVEIESDFNPDLLSSLLSISGFQLELETNSVNRELAFTCQMTLRITEKITFRV